MPSEAADPGAGKPVERIDEEMVVEKTLPTTVEAGAHRKPFGDDPDLGEDADQVFELSDGVLS